MFAPAVEIRLARPGDLPVLANFIARLNARPAQQSLHCAASTPAAVRAVLRNAELFPDGWEKSFVVGTLPSDGEIVAAFGCQCSTDGEPGFLWGPWLDELPGGWTVVAPKLLTRLLDRLPVGVPRVDAFLHEDNRTGLRFLRSHGFAPAPLTHLYVAERVAWHPVDTAAPPPCPPLGPRHEIAFGRLHADIFPVQGATPAHALLDGRDEEHAIFAATAGLRLLGSVCVSVNHAPLEGFVDYLAVKPSARGRGVGARLLGTALRWAFEDRGLPQMALTVSDWRDDARRLYERAGFRLHASGLAARRRL